MTRILSSILLAFLFVSAAPAQESCPKAPEGRAAWFDTCKYLFPGGEVKRGLPIRTPDPEFPESARRQKLKSGQVVVAVALNAKGMVDDVKIVSSSNPVFAQSSVAAVKQWAFNPAMKDGSPVAVQFEVETNFHTY